MILETHRTPRLFYTKKGEHIMDDLKMQKQTLTKAYKKTKRKHITLWKVLTIPVSYTHLDVYKRQVKTPMCRKAWWGLLPSWAIPHNSRLTA